VRLVLLRSAGFNHVDLAAAARLGLAVARVPAYSPHAVAEHTFALLLALVRKLPRAHARVRDGNFSLDGLVGTDLFGKTIGVVGTGQIGAVTAGIARGFGCHVLAVDPAPDPALVAARRSLRGARRDVRPQRRRDLARPAGARRPATSSTPPR
jgi:D-lactate dehydrogenase